MSFVELGLSEALVRGVAEYKEPTAVQEAAIPVVLAGGDLLVTAETGSGKTTAFVLPLLERVVKGQVKSVLILVPTRELAAQVREVVSQCARKLPTRVKVVSAVGGVSINPQMMALRGGADILVATPGRLLALAEKKAVKLSGFGALVLDEADRMLDLGFRAELMAILDLLPKKRQNLLFSATFPKSMEALAGKLLNDPTRVGIEPAEVDKPLIQQRAVRVDRNKRTPLLRHLMEVEKWKRVLVFVATQYGADHVADKLRRNGITALAFHGQLTQTARQEALEKFKAGAARVLVSTDLGARGLDIVELPVVLNYDLPRSTVDYTHRIGRTGRAGASGIAITFVFAEAEAHFRLIEKRQGLRVAREEVEGFEPTETEEAVPVAKGVGGIKGMRKSKKDKLREAAARKRGKA